MQMTASAKKRPASTTRLDRSRPLPIKPISHPVRPAPAAPGRGEDSDKPLA